MSRATRSDVLVELHVPDLARAKRFYRRFGFRLVREEDASAGNGYVVLRHGSSVLSLWGGTRAVRDHTYFRRFRGVRKRGYGVEIVIPVPDVDAAYRVARRAGCVVDDLATRDWGVRDFRAEDPFGFYLRFTEPYAVTRAWQRPRGARRRVRGPAGRARRGR